MKKTIFSILALFIAFTCCENNSEESDKIIKGYYDFMRFERVGGGQIDFNLYETEDSTKLLAIVSTYGSRDTTIKVVIDKDLENTAYFSTFDKALNNQMQIDGDYVETSLPTGTWVRISFYRNDNQVYVTNTSLRDSLLKFEIFVRNRIE
jgi:hypothetical protein